MHVSSCFRRTCLLLVIFLLFPFVKAGAMQSLWGAAGAGQVRKRSSAQAVTPPAGEAPKPQLLNPDSNPTLRYPVAVSENNSVSYGWFDVTRAGVRYTVVMAGRQGNFGGKKLFSSEGINYGSTPAKDQGSEGFEASSREVSGSQLVKNALLIYTSGQRVYLTYLPQDRWGSAQNPRAIFELAYQYVPGTTAILRAMNNFDSVLAEVKPPAPPALDVSLHADPPTVVKGRPVTLVWNSTNATSLDLEPGVGTVAAAGGISLVPQDSTNYTLTATGPAGTKAVSVSVTVTQPAAPLPTLVLTEPSAGGGQTVEVSSSPLTIRGVVMDSTGIPVVTINGKSVTMRPTSAQAAQFRSDPLDLEPGDNKFEVIAVNSAQGQAKVAFVARFSPSSPKAQPTEPSNSKGLGKAEILSLLQGDVPSARVAELVKERGIKFVPTPDDLQQIRGAGGSDDLIDAINQASAPARN